VVLSSHQLDEVEKVCDVAAIVDRGRIVAEGPVGELSAAGTRAVVVQVAEPARALSVLASHPVARSVLDEGPQLRISLGPVTGADARVAAADINRRLVEAGVDVYRLDLPAATLEERFLQVTRLFEAGEEEAAA
jgi:ABC-2 type transport system ATP-binding protein